MTVKELREMTGLSQKAFGKKYHIPKRTLEDWEGGRRKANGTILYLLERAVKEDYKMYRIVAIRERGSIEEFDVQTVNNAEEAKLVARTTWKALSDYDKKYQRIEIRFDEDEDGYDALDWE